MEGGKEVWRARLLMHRISPLLLTLSRNVHTRKHLPAEPGEGNLSKVCTPRSDNFRVQLSGDEWLMEPRTMLALNLMGGHNVYWSPAWLSELCLIWSSSCDFSLCSASLDLQVFIYSLTHLCVQATLNPPHPLPWLQFTDLHPHTVYWSYNVICRYSWERRH